MNDDRTVFNLVEISQTFGDSIFTMRQSKQRDEQLKPQPYIISIIS